MRIDSESTTRTNKAISSPGSSGEVAFHFWVLGVLVAYLVFLAGLTLSALKFTDKNTLCKYLHCKEVIFATKLSLATATVSTLLAMAVAIPAAYALSRYQYRGRSVVDTVLDLPLVLPPIALGFLLLAFFQTSPGEFVQRHGIRFVFEVPGIILAQFTVVSGFAVRVLKSTFDDLSPRYEQVARTLGFSRWQAFRQIELPLARNGLIAGAVLTWARAMGEFGATVIVAGATSMKTEVLPIAIFLKWQSIEIEKGMAVTLLLIALSLAALLTFKRLALRRGPGVI